MGRKRRRVFFMVLAIAPFGADLGQMPQKTDGIQPISWATTQQIVPHTDKAIQYARDLEWMLRDVLGKVFQGGPNMRLWKLISIGLTLCASSVVAQEVDPMDSAPFTSAIVCAQCHKVSLLRFGGHVSYATRFAFKSRSSYSMGLMFPSVEWRRLGL